MPSPKKPSELDDELQDDSPSDTDDDSGDPGPKKMAVRTHTPRPDELSRETFEFIAAIDEYKRRHMRSFLDDREVLVVLRELGYAARGGSTEPTEPEERAYAAARARYRVEKGRLFPTWSEIFDLLMGLGYSRGDQASEREAA